MTGDQVKIVECPRDAWQGLPKIIPTEDKVAYLRRLIESGFRHLDTVSFVAPKYVPQMADSEAVLNQLANSSHITNVTGRDGSFAAERVPTADARPKPPRPSPEIIGIVVNEQGLERALDAPGL